MILKGYTFEGSAMYRKVTSSRLSPLVAHSRIFRLFIKWKFDACVLWPLAKKVQNWIVDRSTIQFLTIFGVQLTKTCYYCHVQQSINWCRVLECRILKNSDQIFLNLYLWKCICTPLVFKNGASHLNRILEDPTFRKSRWFWN